MPETPTEFTASQTYSNYTKTDAVSEFGGEVDLWGATDVTVARVTDPTFSVIFDADVGAGTLRVDDVSVEVFFTLPFGEQYDPDNLPPGAASGWQSGAIGPSSLGPKQFIVVGLGGSIFTSPDGLTWTQQTSGTAANLRSVTASETGYVVTGDNGLVLTSSDGENWTTISSNTEQPLLSVVYSRKDNQFVMVGGSGVVRTVVGGTVQSIRL